MTTRESLFKVLRSLGTSAQEVFEEVFDLYSGKCEVCDTSSSCPLSRFLIHFDDLSPATTVIAYGFEKNTIGVAIPGLETIDFRLSIYPELRGVRDFIVAYDNGEYPELKGKR